MLAAYPPEIRRLHGSEMREAFAAVCRESTRHRGGLIACWVSTLKDFIGTAPAEWLDLFRERFARPGNRPQCTNRPRRENMIGGSWSDLQYAVRQLVKHPGFTAVAVLTLALGIGANTAIFSVVNGVLLRPLAVRHPGMVVMVWESNPSRGWDFFTASPANYVDWVEQNEVFDHIGAYNGGSQTFNGDGEPERVDATFAAASVFEVLGVAPIIGRTFVADENQPGNDGVAVLSHRFWQARFGGDPNAVGQSILLDGAAVEIVGVLPPNPVVQPDTDLWRPLVFDFDVSQSRGGHYLRVIARMKDSGSLERSDAAMKVLARSLEQRYPGSNEGWTIRLVGLHEQIVGNVRTALVVLLGAVGVVLLIVCANVANLLLARASSRQQEIAVRGALGASRMRLMRQLFTESVVLAMAGGVAGVGFAVVGLRLLLVLNPGDLPRVENIGIDFVVLFFTLGIAVTTGAVFGLVPAIQGSRADLQGGLASGGARAGRSPGRATRSVLLVGQVALALVLATGSGLLLRSFRALQDVDPGFDPAQLVSMRVSPPSSRYPQDDHVRAFYDRVQERLAAIPVFSSTGITTAVPLFGSLRFSFEIVGRPPVANNDVPSGLFRIVTDDYFSTMGIPVMQGRAFTSADHAGSPSVIVVNQSLVRAHFRDEEPLGQFMEVGSGNANCPCEIVGVVGDVKQNGLADEPLQGYYLPAGQATWRSRVLVARTTVEPSMAMAAMREAVGSVDSDLAGYNVQTMEERLAEAVALPRFNTVMLGIFAAVALTLAMVGVFGVMSYNVSQRMHEIGVRLALGADHGRITRLVVGRALALAGMGVAIGMAVASGTTRFISGMLFGVDPGDPFTFGIVALLLAAVAGVAAYIPARRAAKVDPMMALRRE